jgi:hypothetical protein
VKPNVKRAKNQPEPTPWRLGDNATLWTALAAIRCLRSRRRNPKPTRRRHAKG